MHHIAKCLQPCTEILAKCPDLAASQVPMTRLADTACFCTGRIGDQMTADQAPDATIELMRLLPSIRYICGSSSRKEENPITAPIDRPVLVLKSSVRKL